MRQFEPPTDWPTQTRGVVIFSLLQQCIQVCRHILAGTRQRRLAAAAETGAIVDTDACGSSDIGSHDDNPTRAEVLRQRPGEKCLERSSATRFRRPGGTGPRQSRNSAACAPPHCRRESRGLDRLDGAAGSSCCVSAIPGSRRKEDGGRECLENSFGRHLRCVPVC